MSLFVTSLNSGSNGNCYYIGNNNEAILVDAGISCNIVEKRMKKLGLAIEIIKAVFISHEHTDHISGLQVLAKKYRLPVYITPSTYNFSRLKLDKDLVFYFNAHQKVLIGELSVTAFPKFHDAADPYSFVISCNKINVGVFTDIGTACENIVHHFKNCHAAFLEANYDDDMLEKGRYPVFLKNRIRGNNGHLSNSQALQLFTTHRPTFMSHLFLSHLSKNNNCPELVYRLFNENAAGVKVVIASRNEETPLYYINEIDAQPQPHYTPASQLSFSFA
jgi:phosphoribosyl 1,2-cyclic phosphodiesterase